LSYWRLGLGAGDEGLLEGAVGSLAGEETGEVSMSFITTRGGTANFSPW